MSDVKQATPRLTVWAIRDEHGKRVARCGALDRTAAIAAFSHPALNWAAYEESGWTCSEEPAAA